MKKRISISVIFLVGFVLFFAPEIRAEEETMKNQIFSDTIKLPEPRYESATSIEKALQGRRSERSYSLDVPGKTLTRAEISQLLWAAQGVTDKKGRRTAPSPGALYPLEVYLVAGEVEGIPGGVYHYAPHTHELIKVLEGDVRQDLCKAGLAQAWITESSAVIVFSAIYERVTKKYGTRGIRYTHIEVGHAAQNVCLQAVSLNLATVTVGAFYDNEVKKVMHLGEGEQALYLMPIGRPRQ